MFSYKEFMEFLSELRDYNERQRLKKMNKYLKSPDFYAWLFKPTLTPATQQEDISTVMSKLYGKLCKKKAVKTIIETIQEYGADEYTRSTATFLFTVVKFCIDAIEDETKTITEQYQSGKMGRGEYKSAKENVESFSTMVAKLNDYINKIVRPDAKKLERTTGLPREIATCILKTCPEKCYIGKHAVSTFTKLVLDELYANVNEYKRDVIKVNWDAFFANLFGKENLGDVASFILVEGRHRIKGMNDNVFEMWRRLTDWALRELNDCDSNTRSQMIEIYIKRLAKLVKNGVTDVRVDLLSIDEDAYPQLSKTVNQYADKIRSILNDVE